MPAEPGAPAVQPRRAPTQARGQATVDAILEATAALLAERGFEGVNTNAVAARAGVKPPAVYRYFPNKFSLYHALAEKLQAELDQEFDAVIAATAGQPLATLIDRSLDAAAAYWLRRPAFGALWYGEWAMHGAPAPGLVFGERTVKRFAAAAGELKGLGELREAVTLGIVIHIGMALVNLATVAHPLREMILGEAKRAVLAYLTDALER